ncbi:hypothetical protein AGLY_008384 [Aphis glycines]|uniref:Uncharacterized protein n=1 Tax=Aphis glycines TaxID=307491 RepID=A0A6G0TK91_APHGL|nr:hypothetical protein AGLY_008384 [Aphis glycines]
MKNFGQKYLINTFKKNFSEKLKISVLKKTQNLLKIKSCKENANLNNIYDLYFLNNNKYLKSFGINRCRYAISYEHKKFYNFSTSKLLASFRVFERFLLLIKSLILLLFLRLKFFEVSRFGRVVNINIMYNKYNRTVDNYINIVLRASSLRLVLMIILVESVQHEFADDIYLGVGNLSLIVSEEEPDVRDCRAYRGHNGSDTGGSGHGHSA